MPVTTDLLVAVNAAFDAERAARNLKTDGALAKSLGISSKTLSLLRNGRWTSVHQALIIVLTQTNLLQQKNN
jgi:DNA-binding Xre family transcriptional regulator